MIEFFIFVDVGEVDKESIKLDVVDMMMLQEVEGISSKDQIKLSSLKSNLKKIGKFFEFMFYRIFFTRM